jgi:hypothetical protein
MAITLVLGCTAQLRCASAADVSRTAAQVDPLLAEIESGDPADLSTFAKVEARRRQTIWTLTKVLRSEAEGVQAISRKARCMFLLGVYRAPEAAPHLAAQFDFVERHYWAEDSPLNPFPACQAILAIGRPAIDALIRSCSAWETEHQFHLAAWTLKYYYRDEDDVGLYRLKRALENAENGKHVDQAYVRSLKRLIAKYEWVEPGNPAHDPKPPKEEVKKE